MSPKTPIHLTESSGNVFADLRVADAEDALVKAEMAHTISSIIAKRHLTQREAARLLGIDQPKISALVRGRLTGFSIDRLLRFLVALDRDVEIIIRPRLRRRSGGRVNVVAVR